MYRTTLAPNEQTTLAHPPALASGPTRVDRHKWIALIAREPRLSELSHLVAGEAVPTRQPEYGNRWLEILDEIERLTRPLGANAFQVARERLHRVYTTSALRESFLQDEEVASEFEFSNRLENLPFLKEESAA